MITEVSAKTGISVDNLLGRSRVYKIVIVRQLYYKLLREKKGLLVEGIGRLCDRDHSTISNGIKHANDLLETKDEYTVRMWDKIKGIEP
ncbi:dnaA protein helix-turn-helix [Porphyromonadaceae bacterium KHP3R9]|nr:dnaA protein helix-turn-helix [Porphyromonadaceae bacterium KH3CP3RA]SFU35593.1 dnaA protein helix-turn-helix [Porphyromonadaceae bacterium KHP3R9]